MKQVKVEIDRSRSFIGYRAYRRTKRHKWVRSDLEYWSKATNRVRSKATNRVRRAY